MKKIILIIAIVLMLATSASAKFLVTSDGKYLVTSDGKFLVTSDHTGGDPYGGNSIMILKWFIIE
jgi:hypothetical protein